MDIGPLQLLAFGFDSNEKFTGEILQELENLQGRGLIRLIDLLFVAKEEDELFILEGSGLNAPELDEFGEVLEPLLGFGLEGEHRESTYLQESGRTGALQVAEKAFGISPQQIEQAVTQMQPGTSAALLLVEHRWAIRFRDATRRAGGFPIMEGFLTPEAVSMVGAEVQAIAEAEAALEAAEAVRGAALLEALKAVVETEVVKQVAADEAAQAVAQAEAIKTAAAAEALNALIAAEIIEEAAALQAAEALALAGLIQETAFQAASQQATNQEEE